MSVICYVHKEQLGTGLLQECPTKQSTYSLNIADNYSSMTPNKAYSSMVT